MQKIETLFERDFSKPPFNPITETVKPTAAWVEAGEGLATRKYDGTCCMVRDGKLYKRYDCKRGKKPPVGFEAAQEPDPKTGHHPGWIPVGDEPDSRWHREAFVGDGLPKPEDWVNGTYELCGPKVQGNPERFGRHTLVMHSLADAYPEFPRTFYAIREAFKGKDIEGVVWHHPDGRMVKIKKKDFGLKRND